LKETTQAYRLMLHWGYIDYIVWYEVPV